MKHFKNKQFFFRRRLLVLSMILALFTPLLASLPVQAAAVEGSALEKEAVTACGKNANLSAGQYDDFQKTPRGSACFDGFKAGYRASGPTAWENVCDNAQNVKYHKGQLYNSFCTTGAQLGHESRNRDDQPDTKGSNNTSTDSDKQIAGYATASDAASCKAGSVEKKNSCIAGYIAGYKGTSQGDVCKNNGSASGYKVSDVSACKEGYSQGKSDQDAGTSRGDSGTGGSAAASATGTTDPADSSSDDGEDAGLQCHTNFNPLTWLLCPVVNGLVTIVDQIDDLITSQLSVGSPGNTADPNQIFCNSKSKATKFSGGKTVRTCDAYKAAWENFRNIALGLLVIVGLMIVIAQATGSELVDAYTIRKAMPRLLIAALGITLSWELMRIFVTFSNDAGYGIRYLIYKPFASIQGAGLGGGGEAALNVLGAAGILSLGIIGLLSFAATAALAVAVAFLVLIFRQLLILVLLILAPIAILMYILPNTNNMYKLWWDSFAKALMMFPLIAGFIATGRVFSAVATANSDNIVGQLIGFVSYFAPYFLLPLTFRFAGGALRGIGGFVNDRGRGGFDRLKNFRGNQVKKNMSDLAQGNRYRANNPLANAVNKSGRFAANAGSAGITPWKMRSRYQAGLSKSEMSHMNEYMEKDQAFAAMKGNDDYLQATMKNMGGGETEDDWRRYLSGQGYTGRSLEQGVASIRAAKRATNSEVFSKAAVMANASTGTGWKEGGAGQMMESINEAAGGDRDMAARMLASMRGQATQARRVDLGGAGFGGQMTDLNEMAGGNMTAQQATERNNAKVLELQSAGAIASARGDSVKMLAPAAMDSVRKAYASGNDVTIKRALAKAANIQDTLAQIPGENGELFADQFFAQPLMPGDGGFITAERPVIGNNGQPIVGPNGNPLMRTERAKDRDGNDIQRTLRSEIEKYRSDPEFRNMRRELGPDEAYAQQMQQVQGGGATGPPTTPPTIGTP